ncbi:MAG: dihydrolipoyl dehydrogenase [Lachnospiraceae bacterium]|nr:dihydrolipoyl dehydrogenase [Lachnospiraceae bacterium]
MQEKYDLMVIGSGPGGYVAAIKAAKMGRRTAVIEKREIGGTCLNRGCIPTKTLMYTSHLYAKAQEFRELGISCKELSYDLNRIQDRKDAVVDKIRQGIRSLLAANGVTIIEGMATILDAHQIQINNAEEELRINTDNILIAAGSKPVKPGIEGIHLPNVITSDELLSQREKLYQRLLIIGGGVIGIELATYYQEMGSAVEVIEAMDRILPNMDKEISQSIAMNLKKKGVIIHTKAKVVKISETPDGELLCDFEEKNAAKSVCSDGILVAVGRRANTEGLFGPDFSLAMDGAHIKVNEKFQTSIDTVYAIGDVIKGRQLAHAASAQGVAAVEIMCNRKPSLSLEVIPSCVYTEPEVAVVGINEEEAKAKGIEVKVGKYPMLGNSKTLLSTGERGFIKVICDAATDRILGAVLLCERATDMIGEFVTAIANGLTAHDLASVIRPHPTYEEAVTEAVEDIYGTAIYLLPKRR